MRATKANPESSGIRLTGKVELEEGKSSLNMVMVEVIGEISEMNFLLNLFPMLNLKKSLRFLRLKNRKQKRVVLKKHLKRLKKNLELCR